MPKFGEEKGQIWMNGKFVDWKDAKIHVLSHVVHYGSGIFEGDRCYDTPKGAAIFRLDAHIKRLFDSCKIYRMKIPFTEAQLTEAVLETVRANGMKECYIRPLVYRGYHSLGVNPYPCPVDVCIAVWEWGSYLGAEAVEQGVDVMVSTWRRAAPDTFPAMAKCVANYMNSQLIKMEAIEHGYVEAIALDTEGYISEGSGENIFLVRDGKLYTPPFSASVLPGITRDSVMTLARDLGYAVEEMRLPREMLHIADEVFFTGSAAEITPVRSVDKIPVGDGKRGPVTERLQKEFHAVIRGERPDTHKWLAYVYKK
jgi:branched-chain amino acid aminotransferase